MTIIITVIVKTALQLTDVALSWIQHAMLVYLRVVSSQARDSCRIELTTSSQHGSTAHDVLLQVMDTMIYWCFTK